PGVDDRWRGGSHPAARLQRSAGAGILTPFRTGDPMELEFLGAAGSVTGSCYLLRTSRHTLLLEGGQIQGSKADEEENRAPFPVPVEEIDAVVLSHAHIDHSGRLPLLYREGYRGPIHTHSATRALCSIMLRDSAYLHEKDADWENK